MGAEWTFSLLDTLGFAREHDNDPSVPNLVAARWPYFALWQWRGEMFSFVMSLVFAAIPVIQIVDFWLNPIHEGLMDGAPWAGQASSRWTVLHGTLDYPWEPAQSS